jgi:hypothetical protein
MTERLIASPQSEPVSHTSAEPRKQTSPDVLFGYSEESSHDPWAPHHWVLST